MNRFIIANTPREIAQQQCDKHVVKMPLEEAQMLSTVHRLLDGIQETRPSKSGKRQVKYWKHPIDQYEQYLYKAVHMNHPCTKWAMETRGNYLWAYELFIEMCNEYTHRYGKVHLSEQKLKDLLRFPPNNIGQDTSITQMPLAMGSNPECIDTNDVIGSYRAYYKTKQARFDLVWTKRETPNWWSEDGKHEII